MTTTLNKHSRLSPEQTQKYHQDGYLLFQNDVLPQGKFNKLKDHFDDTLAALPAGSRPELMDVPHFTDIALFEWLFADEILDLVEPITGPDIALFASAFVCKPKGDGKRIPWHEDSAYWKGMVAPMEIVTIWLAIDPSTPQNGCMYVIPRTHREAQQGFSDYQPVDTTVNVFPTEIVESQRETARAVPCVLQANQASLHDGRLMHGSPANTSPLRRCGYTMRYMSTKCRLSEKFKDSHNIYLARGRDLAGQDYADPSKSYADSLARRLKIGKRGH